MGDEWCREEPSCWLDQVFLAVSPRLADPGSGCTAQLQQACSESSGGCECFGRNMSRHTSPDLLWDYVPFALLRGFRLEQQPNPCRQSFHELGSSKATRPLVPPKPLGVGCSWSSLDFPSTSLGRLEGSALKGSTVVLLPFSWRS